MYYTSDQTILARIDGVSNFNFNFYVGKQKKIKLRHNVYVDKRILNIKENVKNSNFVISKTVF